MNFRTTIALFLTSALVGVLVWKRDAVTQRLGFADKTSAEPTASAQSLFENLRADQFVSVTVRVAGSTPVEFKAPAAGQPLELPGNWPVRRNEVAELIGALTTLKSRFKAELIGETTPLEKFGLSSSSNPSPVLVEILSQLPDGSKRTDKLEFGQAPATPGTNPFLLPAFVRVNDESQVFNIGQEVLAVLRRPLDFYRKRQLFPEAERVKVADSPRDAETTAAAFLLTDTVTGISAQGPNGSYTLTRKAPTPKPSPLVNKPTGEAVVLATALAESWRLSTPVDDRVDPIKLKNILLAVPDLWVEQFIVNPDPLISLTSFSPILFGDTPLNSLSRYSLGLLEANSYSLTGPFLDITGLSRPSMTLTVSLADGSSRTLLIGRVSRTDRKTEPAPPPMIPGQPPSPPKVTEIPYYFAKVANTSIAFEIRGERLAEVFLLPPKPEGPKVEVVGKAHEQLRDSQLTRFDTEFVKTIDVRGPSQQIELVRTKADPNAETESRRKERWDLTIPFTGLAESKQVTDLLEPINKLAAKRGEIIDRQSLHFVTGSLGIIDLRVAGLIDDQVTTVSITSDEKTKTPVQKVLIGKRDATAKKLFAWSPETPNRLNWIDDSAWPVLERQARVYRALKLFDLGDNRVESILVTGLKSAFNLKEVPGAKKTYQLTLPVLVETDAEKSGKLLSDLGSLEATEFVYDPPSEREQLAIRTLLGVFGEHVLAASASSFGLDQPSAKATLTFAGANPLPPRQLLIGKPRPGKPEYYAQLEGSSSVFAIKKEVPDVILAGSLGLLPTQLWNGSPDGLTVAEFTKGKDPAFVLSQINGAWKLTAPFQAEVDAPSFQPLAAALSAIKVDRYEAHAPKTLAEYGLDQPSLRIKFSLTERLVDKPGDEPKESTKERVLLIGKPEADGKSSRFAMLEGDKSSAVFVLNDKTLSDLDKPALELLNKKLLNINSSAITKLELSGPDGPISLEKQNNEWKPIGANFSIDKQTVEQLVKYLSSLSALKFADYRPNLDLPKYGLDPASKPVVLKVSLGTENHTVEIGKVAEGTPNDRFVRVDGSNAVAILAVTTARDLTKSKLDLVDRSVFAFDPIDLQVIRRTQNGQEFELSLDGSNWGITKPAKTNADQLMVEELAERLGKLRADRIADIEGKDLAKFGLAQPTATIKLEMIGKGGKSVDKTLKIGSPVEAAKPDGERFAQLEGANTVIVLSASISKRLLAEPIKFRDRNLANFVTADKAVVTRSGKDTTLEKVGGTWKVKLPTPSDAEDEGLRDLLDAIARLRAEEIVADKPADLKPYGLDKPDRWRWFNGEKEVLNLLVGSREKVNGTETMRVYAKLEKSDLVVLLDMALSTKLLAEYRKRALWETLDVAQADSIMIDTAEGPGSFKLLKGPTGWFDPTSKNEGIDTSVVTDFLDAIAGLKAERFVETDAKEGAKIYGLEPPRKTITVSTQTGQRRTLLLGRLDDQKRVYGQGSEKTPTVVFILSSGDTAKVNRERAAFNLTAPKKEEPKKLELKK